MSVMAAVSLVFLSVASRSITLGVQDLYTLDSTWQPRFPSGAHTFSAVGVAYMNEGLPSDPPAGSLVFVTQRGNASIAPVLVMNATDGALLHSWGKDSVGLDYTVQPSAPTWGAHGLAVEECNYPCESDAGWYAYMRVYVDDFTNHTLTMYTGSGKRLLQLGQNGVAGNSTSPLQFGNVADSAIQTGLVFPSPTPPSPSYVYSSDGDGGSANRVTKVALSGHTASLEWATKAIYDNPHSIAFHGRSNLLILADREHNETRLLRAADGEDLGAWNCGLEYGKHGKPFAVRTLSYYHRECQQHHDLVMVGIMDNPQDGLNQRIAILDGSGLSSSEGVQSKCKILQELRIESKYSGPHLLGLDTHNGDMYAALVADKPLSTVLRFKMTGCSPTQGTIHI